MADPGLSPDGARPLTSVGEVKGIVPARPGIYAAWIDDERALKAAGIDGPSPRCVYIGKAQAAGLSSRIGTHVASSFPWLNEMLAARGLVLFNWANRFRPPMRTKYYVDETPWRRSPTPRRETGSTPTCAGVGSLWSSTSCVMSSERGSMISSRS